MAASAVDAEPTGAEPSPVQTSEASLPSSATVNGARKRSRTGSLVASPPPNPVPSQLRETPVEKIQLEQYLNREFKHIALEAANRQHPYLVDAKRREIEFYKGFSAVRREHPAAIFGSGYGGLGNSVTDQKVNPQRQVTYPENRKRPGKRQGREIRVSRKALSVQADQREELVPIRLDVEFEKIKLRDTFTWNLYERTIDPVVFAQHLVEDFQLPLAANASLSKQIGESLAEQISEYHPHIAIEDDALDPHLPYYAYKNDEMRILIKLNITIGQATLVDQFEWDLNNPLNSPEEFAMLTARENYLSGEFTTAIAHSIREQVQLFTRSLFITGHAFDGRPVEDADLTSGFLSSPLQSPFRAYQTQKDFGLYVYDLNEGELERTELSISREQRRQKRSTNRRGGPALPDLKDRQRTIRTSIISKLFPGAVETLEESRIFKRTASNRNRRAQGGQRDGNDDSDDSESEDTSPDSPAVQSHLLQGTARTRERRGAASAAQAAMRAATAGRSATPEAALHHHETRTSARRFGGRDYREESSEENDKLIVKLKIPKEKLKAFLRDPRSRTRPQPQSPFPSQKSHSGTPQISTPIIGNMAPPHPAPGASRSPAQQPQLNGGTTTSNPPAHQVGVVDAPHPPTPGNPAPSPPQWLSSGLTELQSNYPNDSFEGTMRYTAVDMATGTPLGGNALQPGQQHTPNVKYQYFPRIRCHDCPGKLYTPGPGTTVENFEVHLRNRQHRERVDARVSRGATTFP